MPYPGRSSCSSNILHGFTPDMLRISPQWGISALPGPVVMFFKHDSIKGKVKK